MLRAVAAADAASVGAIAESEKGQPNGVAALDVNGKIESQQFQFGGIGDVAGPLDAQGKIPASQLPPLDHDVGEAADEAAMLALAVSAPAVCIRTDFTPPHVFYLTADPASTLANWHDTGEFGAGGADPSATVGLTAKNGVANTFMRSDGAPALDQTIAPTWTAGHRFTAVSAPTVPTVQLSSTNPQFDMNVTAGAVDNRRWNLFATGATFTVRALNDAGTTASNAWAVTRAAAAVSQHDWYINNVATLALSSTALTTIVPETVVTGTDGNKIWLAKYTTGTGHSNAPTAIGATSTYLQVGGREYGNNGYGGIGFSYVSAATDHPAVWIGWQERNTAGNTNGDFVVATRSATTNTAPTERFRITNLGAWSLSGLANTGTAGQVISSTGAGTPPVWADMPFPQVVGSDAQTAQSANVNRPNIYTVAVGGTYRVSSFIVITQAATTSATMPGVSVAYTEAATGTAVQDILSLSSAMNTVGSHSGGSAVIACQQGSSISYSTNNYASAGATAMQYRVGVIIERLS